MFKVVTANKTLSNCQSKFNISITPQTTRNFKIKLFITFIIQHCKDKSWFGGEMKETQLKI